MGGVTGGPRSPKPPPHPWDGFLAGPENALALAGATALARGEGDGISPLVVHGPSGVGKSRLLAGLVAERLARRPGSTVAHLTAEAFAAACHAAAEDDDGWAGLRDRFRGLDLLVLDDLHALARAPLAVEELAHTLDALSAGGGAVAVAARSGPGQWADLPTRLVDRLVGGLSVRLEPPGPEARRRYAREGARSRGVPLAAEALDALAEAADGYPAIDGWLARLALSGRVDRKPAGAAAVAELLEDEPGGVPTVDDVAEAVAARFGVRRRDLRSASRRPGLVGPRHLAMLLAREVTGRSFAAIGAHFGKRDAATVRHACRAAAARMAADPALAAAVEALRQGWGRRGNDGGKMTDDK